MGGLLAWGSQHSPLEASSHREALLIASDPLADNTGLYVLHIASVYSGNTLIQSLRIQRQVGSK